ncbi:MAG: type IV pilus assembly protein PilY1 [Halioglobus sp.]|jgi:type IV pilus assembly protein PilY1
MMKQLKLTILLLGMLLASVSLADDIDIFVAKSHQLVAPHIHLIIDLADDAFETVCRYGETQSCGSLLSGSSYVNLDASHQQGDAVSHFDLFRLVLSAVLKESRFGRISLALILSQKYGEFEQLTDYINLGEDRDGIDGFDRVIDVLNTISEADDWTSLAQYSTHRQLVDSLRGQLSTLVLSPSLLACSTHYSIVLATDTVDGEETQDNNHWLVTGYSADSEHSALQNILYQKLARALAQILIIDHTKVVSSVTPNMLVSALDLAELYVGLFQPQPLLRWPGNVKKFALTPLDPLSPNILDQILDARGMPAMETEGQLTGHIAAEAISLWTQNETQVQTDEQGVSDGPRVTRGGAGQRIPGYFPIANIGDSNGESGARQVYIEPQTITNGHATPLVAFDANGSFMGSTAVRLKELLGVPSIAHAQTMIRWGRGQDVDDEDGDSDTGDARSWMLGSVIHSTPLVLNYGAISGYSKKNPLVRLFFGTGDGLFHGIENTTLEGDDSGREVFALYPNSALANIGLLRANVVSATEMRYGVDGSASSFIIDNNGDGNISHVPPERDQAYVYFGLRRGGYSYTALNVSDPSVPPSLQWKISRTTNGDFDELGLSFSKPLIGKVKFSQQVLDVVIFAGGYHGGWNDDYSQRIGKDLSAEDDFHASDSHGNSLFIVNARTGNLVWKAVYGDATSTASTSTNTQFQHRMLVDSIPSTVSAVRNPGGIIHRLYVGDTGGAVWRVDLPPAAETASSNHRQKHWFISKLAELGADGENTDRRFFHAPDIIRSREDSGRPFDGVLISSGDRAHPNEKNVANYHFYLKDFLISSGDDAARARPPIQIADTDIDQYAVGGDDLAGAPRLANRTACRSSEYNGSESACMNTLEHGWMLEMVKPGEKSLASPLVDGGKVLFTSYVPAQERACAIDQGASYIHLVNLQDASQVSPAGRVFLLGEGLASRVQTLGDYFLSPLGGMGEIPGVSCQGKLCGRFAQPLQTIYWREMNVDDI